MSKPVIEVHNLADLRQHLTGPLVRWSKNPDGGFTIYLSKGPAIKVRGVRTVERGSHLLLRDRSDGRLMIPLSSIRLKSKWWHSMLLSIIGLGISLFLGFSANLGFHWFENPKPSIKQQIDELDSTQTLLSELQKYVIAQQETLKELSVNLHLLKKEKSTIETILETDREKVHALLNYAGKRNPIDRWIEWGIAFLIGVFSSLVATLLWHYFRNIRKIAQRIRIDRVREANHDLILWLDEPGRGMRIRTLI